MTETTTYFKGQRLRYQYGQELTLVRDCAQDRMQQIDDRSKTFLSLPVEDKAGVSAAKTTVVDTDETRQSFGHTARHLKLTQPAEGAQGRVEIDGWYLNVAEMPACAADPNQKAAGVNVGLPVSYTATSYKDGTQPPATFSMEVTALVEAPLEAALFEVPAGYTDALKAVPGVAPKAPGAIRVGVVALQNKSSQSAIHAGSYDHMVAQLRESGLDVVPVPAGTADNITAQAAKTQCDYLLYSDVTSVEKPAAAKVGGLLRHAPGIGRAAGNGGADAYEAHVEYRLVPVSGGAPALASTAIGKTGSTFNWKTAVSVASSVTPMMMMAKMYGAGGAFNPLMNTLVTGNAYGPMGMMDPAMSSMSMFMRVAGGSTAAPANPTAADHAIAAALEQEVKAVAARLGRHS